MKKCVCVWTLVVLICMALCGCGGKPVPAEAALKTDLSNHTVFSSYANALNISISDLEIIKRQTTVEDKIDQAWVRVDVSGPKVEGEMYYLMTYELYNDGWLLESTEETDIDQWKLAPLSGIGEDAIIDHLPAGAKIESNNVNLETGNQIVAYSYKESFPNCDIIHRRELHIDFSGDYYGPETDRFGMWRLQDDVEAGTVEAWTINGTWTASGKRRHQETEAFTLTINGFDPGGVAYDQNKDNNVFPVQGTLTYHSDTQCLDYNFREYHKTKDFKNENETLEAEAYQNPDGEVTYTLRARGKMQVYDPSLIESQQHREQADEITVRITRNEIAVVDSGVGNWTLEQ